MNGQNLLAEIEGSLQYLGFYTTRTGEAGTEAALVVGGLAALTRVVTR